MALLSFQTTKESSHNAEEYQLKMLLPQWAKTPRIEFVSPEAIQPFLIFPLHCGSKYMTCTAPVTCLGVYGKSAQVHSLHFRPPLNLSTCKNYVLTTIIKFDYELTKYRFWHPFLQIF